MKATTKVPAAKATNSGAPQLLTSRQSANGRSAAPPSAREPLRRAAAVLGSDFSDVRLHPRSPEPAALGATAMAKGNDVHFTPGAYRPATSAGRWILGHELAHVVQQRENRITTGKTRREGGETVSTDRGLENEADDWGRRLSRSAVSSPPPAGIPQSLGSAPTGGPTPVVQLLRAGLEPINPNNYRQNIYGPVANDAFADLDGAKEFSDALKQRMHTRNRTNGAPTGAIAIAANAAQSSDIDQSPLIPYNMNPATYTPAVDHIVRKENTGSNSIDNARIVSTSQNSTPANNLSSGGAVRVALYENHTSGSGANYNQGDTLDRAAILDITGMDIAQNTFAGKKSAVVNLDAI